VYVVFEVVFDCFYVVDCFVFDFGELVDVVWFEIVDYGV